MFRRVLVVVGTVTLSIAALFTVMWLVSSPPAVAHADPGIITSEASTNTTSHPATDQVAILSCVAVTSDIFISDTWTAPCYRVMTNTVTIHPDVIITISPPGTGTRVEFLAGAQLQVWGTLYALGGPGRPITFTSVNTTSPGRGDWLGIVLEDNGGGDLVQHSVVEYASTGFKINDEDNVSILSSAFRRNDVAIAGNTDDSLIANNSIYSCTDGIVLKKSYNNQIISNTIYDVDSDGLAFIVEGAPGGNHNEIRGNEVYNCGRDGLRIEDGDENEISNNEIHRCGRNGTRLDSGYRNTLSGNLLFLNNSEGIYLAAQEVASVQYNHVYSNGGGSGYRAAVYITGVNDVASNHPDISHNVIYDRHGEAIEYAASNDSPSPAMALNALCSIHGLELQNDDSATISAASNWWSTNTPTDSVSGPVDFTPWVRLSLYGTADGAVTITLRDRDGNTVPPPSALHTDPPAPNARRIALASNWGTLNPAVVFVDGDGITTTTLIPGEAPGPETIVLTATDFCGYSVTGTVQLPNLAITKTAAVTQVVAGDVLTYRIGYANAGGAVATDVHITDTLPVGTAWVDDTAVADGWARMATAPPAWFTPTLPPGARGSFVLSVTVVPTACGLGLTNWVTIGTPAIEPTLDDNVASAGPITVVCADLEVAKSAHPPAGPPSAPISFTIAYTNNSEIEVANAIITDRLPEDTGYLADTSGLPCPTCRIGALGPLTWTITSLSPGEDDSFTLTLGYTSAVCPATLTNTVAISSAIPDLRLQDNWYTATYRVLCDVDLAVVKDDDVGPTSALHASLNAGQRAAAARLSQAARENDPLAVTHHRDYVRDGDLVTYTIAVVNVGSVTATNVVLTETLPEHTDYVGLGWIPVSHATYITTVGTLPPGDGRVAYFVVRVHDPLPAGVDNLDNLVCGGSEEEDVNPDDNCNREDTPVRRWPLRVEKSAEDCISPGDEFNYRIAYRNATTDTAFYDVGLTDTLDAYVSYVGGSEWNCVGQICGRTLPAIPPGFSDTLLLPVQLSAAFPYTFQTSITNVVEIQWGNRFTLTTPIDTGPDLSVVKNDNVGPLTMAQQARWETLAQRLSPHLVSPLEAAQHREFVRPGERITYTILYLNDGFSPATGVALTETLPEHTSYVGGGWTHAGGHRYTLQVGDLPPGEGGEAQFVVQVDDPFPPGIDRVVNRVDIGGDTPECDLDNNWSADDTPVRSDTKLYVANYRSGTVDVFDTIHFDYLTTIPVGANPYGMAADGNHLFVVDFDEPASNSSLYVVDTLSDTVIASTTGVGAHPVHVVAYDGHVYVASHSGPPPITVASADPPWGIVAQMYLDLPLTYEFGFFGAAADEERGCIYLTKPDFGSLGIWRVTPRTSTWQLDYVYPMDEAPRSILYHPATDRVYAAFGWLDELWVLDPEDWELLDRIPTGHQDSTYPGYGAHGLTALGQCVFVSNYRDQSVTAVVGGSCMESRGADRAGSLAGSHRIYLPVVGKDFSAGRRIVTIPLSGRPEGMTGRGNLLFVTLSSEDEVAIINTEMLTVTGVISIPGDYPHTVILAGGN